MQYVILTLADATLYALLGLAITLVLGLTGLVNFAQGDLMAVGAFGFYYMVHSLGLPLSVGIVVAIFGTGVLAVALERTMFRFTFRIPINGFLISLGLVLVIENILTALTGAGAEQANAFVGGSPSGQTGVVSWQQIITIVTGIVLLGAVELLFRRTRWGLSIRAMSVDRETAASLGTNVNRNVMLIFLLSGAITGVAAALTWGLFPIYSTMGSQYVLFGFAVALLGGAGSATGALVASVIVAVVETVLTAAGQASWESAAAFLVMVAVLLVRPSGLAGVA